MRRRLLWLALVGTLHAQADTPANEEALPSIELLEYLADFIEDEDGRLVDPLSQTAEDETARAVSYREDPQRQNDR